MFSPQAVAAFDVVYRRDVLPNRLLWTSLLAVAPLPRRFNVSDDPSPLLFRNRDRNIQFTLSGLSVSLIWQYGFYSHNTHRVDPLVVAEALGFVDLSH